MTDDAPQTPAAPEPQPTTPEAAPPATAASDVASEAVHEPVNTSPVLTPVEGEWRGISPKYITVDLVTNAIFGVLFVAASIVAVVTLEWPPIGWLVPVGVLLVSVIPMFFIPRRMRAIGYQLRADDMLFRTGLLFRRMVAVPYGRMQLVDINRGPIARAVGLAELKLITAAAATAVTIPGLPVEEAEALRDHLVAVAETRRAGL